MTDLVVSRGIAPMSDRAIEAVRKFEAENLKKPQVNIPTDHVLHGGMYARTILLPAGVRLTGALIKIATMLIIQGSVMAYMELNNKAGAVQLDGYNVLPASPRRKQAFLAQTDTWMTMIFPTKAQTVEQAEAEFTSEPNLLFSRNVDAENQITITGD